LPAGLPVTQRLAAGGSAISLYALPIVQPLLGLAASALHGDRVILSGGLVLPRLVSADRTLAHALFQPHGAAGCVFLALIGLHAAAALHHHFVRKDHVLTAMLPGVPMVPGGSGSAP
jgi:cytochrome b561